MANGSLLQQIANPVVANFPGAILAGRTAEQGLQAGRLGQQTTRNQLALQGQQITQGRKLEEAQILTEVSRDIMAAFSVGGPNQLRMLEIAKGKIPQGSSLTPAIDDLINTPQGPELDKKLLMAMDFMRNAGFLPKAEKVGKAEKTAEQLQAEIDAKTESAKPISVREFEFSIANPKFALQQQAKKDKEQIKAIKDKVFTNSRDLRKEYLAQSKDFIKVRDAFTRVNVSVADPSPAGDLSLIFNYMKMLDPNSVVRESEFAQAAASGSLGERMKAVVGKVASGKRLTEIMRNDFVSKSQALFKGAEQQHGKREKNYTLIANKNNLPVDEVVVSLNRPVEPAAIDSNQAPQAALDFLTQNPQTINQFVEKFGFRPEGF